MHPSVVRPPGAAGAPDEPPTHRLLRPGAGATMRPMKWVWTIVAFAGLIIFHELGHFLLARLSGMKVERFSVGFGPVLLKKQVGDVEYALCALPLGGYVKIAGMDPSEEGADTDPRAYNNRPVWQRLLVIFAGPAFNYVLAAVLFTTVFLLGPPVPNPSTATVGQVLPGRARRPTAGSSAATRSSRWTGKKVTDWTSLRKAVSPHAGQQTTLGIERDGKPLTVTITPEAIKEQLKDGKTRTVGQIGVGVSTKRAPALAFGPAVVRGLEQTWYTNVRLVDGVAALFKGASGARLEGPVAIIKTTSEAAGRGHGAAADAGGAHLGGTGAPEPPAHPRPRRRAAGVPGHRGGPAQAGERPGGARGPRRGLPTPHRPDAPRHLRRREADLLRELTPGAAGPGANAPGEARRYASALWHSTWGIPASMNSSPTRR